MEHLDNNFAYERAKKKAKEIRAFYINLICYLLVIPVLIAINLIYTPNYYWFLFSAVCWGGGVILHGLGTYGYMPFLGRNWEDRKFKELVEKERQKQSNYNR